MRVEISADSVLNACRLPFVADWTYAQAVGMGGAFLSEPRQFRNRGLPAYGTNTALLDLTI